ncbi:MAG: hypothetical protein WD471_02065 [Candidatus Paceibacterota bacterium]
MCDINTQTKEFLEKLETLKQNKQPAQIIPLLIVEYGVAELVNVLRRNSQRELAYYIIKDHSDKLTRKQLRCMIHTLWRGGGVPLYKWVLYACKDCKEQLGEYYYLLVWEAINTEDENLCACLIFDCDLTDKQKVRALKMVAKCSNSSNSIWRDRLLKNGRLNSFQKQILQTESMESALANTG